MQFSEMLGIGYCWNPGVKQARLVWDTFWQIYVLMCCVLQFSFLIIYQKRCASSCPFKLTYGLWELIQFKLKQIFQRIIWGREVASPFSQMYKKLFMCKKLVLWRSGSWTALWLVRKLPWICFLKSLLCLSAFGTSFSDRLHNDSFFSDQCCCAHS